MSSISEKAFNKMTIEELKKELDCRNVSYQSKLKKAEYQDLLSKAVGYDIRSDSQKSKSSAKLAESSISSSASSSSSIPSSKLKVAELKSIYEEKVKNGEIIPMSVKKPLKDDYLRALGLPEREKSATKSVKSATKKCIDNENLYSRKQKEDTLLIFYKSKAFLVNKLYIKNFNLFKYELLNKRSDRIPVGIRKNFNGEDVLITYIDYVFENVETYNLIEIKPGSSFMIVDKIDFIYNLDEEEYLLDDGKVEIREIEYYHNYLVPGTNFNDESDNQSRILKNEVHSANKNKHAYRFDESDDEEKTINEEQKSSSSSQLEQELYENEEEVNNVVENDIHENEEEVNNVVENDDDEEDDEDFIVDKRTRK